MVEYVMSDKQNYIKDNYANEEEHNSENSFGSSRSKVDLNNLIKKVKDKGQPLYLTIINNNNQRRYLGVKLK